MRLDMTAPECAAGCGRPSPGARICGACADGLSAALTMAASIEGDLLAAVARQLRHGGGGRRSGDEVPLPYDPAAADAAEALRGCLSGWVAVIARCPPPAGRIGGMARWLGKRVQHVSRHEAAADIASSVRRAVDRAVMVLDGPPELHPAGDCECGAPLLADARADEARCRACGTVTAGIEASRRDRAARADVLGDPTAISRALAGIGITVPAGTIRSWASRGRLGERPGGAYAMSEVLALKAASDQRKAPG